MTSLFPSLQEYTDFATVIVPLPMPKLYTYAIPVDMLHLLKKGMRVEIQFGKSKRYSALIYSIHKVKPKEYSPKPILSVIDETPIVTEMQLKMWRWIADYYCSTMGEVMNASLPAGLKLNSETFIQISPLYDDDPTDLNDKEYLIVEALSIQKELTIESIQKILNQKTVYPIIKGLLDKKIIYIKEELKTKYKPKSIQTLQLKEPYKSDSSTLKFAFEKLGRANRQMETLLGFLQLSKTKNDITRKNLSEYAGATNSSIKGLIDKGILYVKEVVVSRLDRYKEETITSFSLSEQQVRAIAEIKTGFKDKNTILLHGVTGSGKTRVYVELIQEALARGEQVLYLLPEIGLTAQIIFRLQKIFGDDIAVYHSKLNNGERVEVWQQSLSGQKPIILGARSGLMLPFKNLQLIIVDEEHDPSFKQHDPSPRYNARDTAIYLAHLFGAKVVLGTATPAIETYRNAQIGKYGLVEMKERFGGINMPEIVVVDAKKEMQQKKMKSHFTSVLIEHLKTALENGEQAIIFQNRRGYAPTLRCETCAWTAMCMNCDVSLTYHMHSNNLRCHYCGYQTAQPKSCTACGSHKLTIKGFGTEKVEDELKIYLPTAKVARMDWDTVRTKNAHAQIINDFEEKRIDILVGTQMVTKGLDFDNVGIVGVMSADHLLYFPDFRATERAYQLITQVSGRAGRKKKQGKVVIQAFNVNHPVIHEVRNYNFDAFYKREIAERREFIYPPFFRLIKITLKHKKQETLFNGGRLYSDFLRERLGKRLIGPSVPSVPRIRNYYLLDLMIKLERKSTKIKEAKDIIRQAREMLHSTRGFSGIRVNVDVDPY